MYCLCVPLLKLVFITHRLFVPVLLANDGEGIKAVEKDPLTMFTVLLGLDAVENRAEIITEVTKLLDMKTPFDRQLSTLDEVRPVVQ